MIEGCPCPRCGLWHEGTCCHDACAICNRHHQGKCSGKVGSSCSLCGEPHQPWRICPCPRCFYRHGHGDCPSVEEWRVHACSGQFSSFVGSCCALCGQQHNTADSCPCPRCHLQHLHTNCPVDVIIGMMYFDGDGAASGRRCLRCGECHDVGNACPCPLCLRDHANRDCFDPVVSCRPCPQCNVWHGGNHRHLWMDDTPSSGSNRPCPCCNVWHGDNNCADYSYQSCGHNVDVVEPCHLCNVWHGVDVCPRSDPLCQEYRPVRVPRALMVNRAVASISRSAMIPTEAPAHSDATTNCHHAGSMSVSCNHCGARFWQGEKIECCFEGSLILADPHIPESLQRIILSPAVMSHIRSYNMSMAMASVGHQKGGFPDGVFTMSGKSYHRIGTLIPSEDKRPCFAQIYSLDTSEATERRSQLFGDRLNREVLSALHDELLVHNRYVAEFVRAASSDVHELVWTTEDDIMGMQMGAMVCANGSHRRIVIKRRRNEHTHDLQCISDSHALYHTLAYPLLFPTGATGWYQGMSRCERDGLTMKTVSLHDFGRYILMHRER